MPDNALARRRLILSTARSVLPDSLSGGSGALSHPFKSNSLLPHLDQSGYTPTQSFFRQQIRQIVDIDALYWSIRLDGLVRMPLNLTVDALQVFPSLEIACTIACDGNAPRNTLIGHALWKGIPATVLLEQLEILPEGHYVSITAADGYTSSLTLEAFSETMLVYGMNGNILPREHGYPVRLIAPGLYGYKMPKWIRHIEFTNSLVPGFWESRGSAMSGEVQPLVMIFSPHHQETLKGVVAIGGIAYAGGRDISMIEVSIDDAPWMPVPFVPGARLSWTPWQIEWNPPAPGDYHIRVRMSNSSSSRDSGSHHSVVVRVV